MTDQHNDTPTDGPDERQPPAPDAPATPTGPPVPPKRRGLPGWAWAVIGGGALLLIGIIVVVVIVASTLLGAVSQAGRAGGQPADPTATATDDASATPEQTDAPASPEPTEAGAGIDDGALIAVDDQADFGGTFPIWGYPMPDGWEITVFDEAGVNQSTNEELDCQFTSSQNKQSAQDLEATDDLSDTLTTIEALEQGVLENGTGAELNGDLGSTDFALSTPDGQGRLEFVTSRIDFMDPNLQMAYTNEIAGRAMPLSESFMYIVVTCPTALVDAGGSPFEDLRAGLQVLVE